MKTILHALHIHAQPSAPYAALTTAEGLAGWWSTRVSVEPGEKGLIRFTFAGDFNPVMRQDRAAKDREVRWTCVDGHANWQDNTFSFRIEPRKSECVLLFTQEYAQELDDETYGTYNFNWGYYLNSLKRLCETGTGTPFTGAQYGR
jgi:Activator of Hsp90 ATPase homolog 1-like protein